MNAEPGYLLKNYPKHPVPAFFLKAYFNVMI
jgi:hypothetical protein